MHPHPATVHFPIAYIVLGTGLNVLQSLQPKALSTHFSTTDDVVSMAVRYLYATGLIASVPAILTGTIDMYKLAMKQGLYDPSTGRLKEKVKVAGLHSVATGIAIAGVFFLWQRSAGTRSDGKWVIVMEVFNAALLLYGAKLGGALAFEYGMGFSARKEKKK